MSVAAPEEIPPPELPPSEMDMAAPIEAPGAWAMFSVFRHRNYRLFFAGQLVSLMGTWMQSVAQGWLVYDLTHSPFLLGVTAFAGQAPVFFMSPFGGAIADRVDKRRLIILTQLLSMVQATLLATLTLGGWIEVWQIVCLALCMGLINAFDIPTRQAFVMEMVGRKDLRNAIALNSVMFNLARIVGPTAAGLIVALAGEGICFAINAASYAAVLAGLFAMQVSPHIKRVAEHPWRELKAGFAYAWRVREIRVSLLLVAISSCFGASYLTLMPAFARDILHEGSEGLGLLMASVGLGALAGGYWLSRLHDRHLSRTPIYASAAFGFSLIVFAHSHWLPVSMALLLPTAFFLMLLGGSSNTIIQTVAEDRFRGRVVAFYAMSFMGMMPWGSLLLGWMASHVGIGEAVTIGACVVIAAAIYAWFDRSRRGDTRADHTSVRKSDPDRSSSAI